MSHFHPFSLVATALALAGAVAFQAAAAQTDFVAASRTATECALLDAAGRIHVFDGKSAFRTIALTDGGRPLKWRHTPTALARWRADWVVADGSGSLRLFNSSGNLVRTVAVPSTIFDLAVAGERLWAANVLTRSPAERLWFSTDARQFTKFPLKDDVTDPASALLRSQMIIAGSSAGDLVVAHLIGPPVVNHVFPPGRGSWPVAYSRSARRAALERSNKQVQDLTLYSAPFRDMVVAAGALILLRNREDVRTAGGIVQQQGYRADRYDLRTGRHLASATFPRTMRWLLRSDDRHVVAVTRDGVVHSVAWGKPIPGGIIR